jgi:hypothetical protein
MGSRQDGITSLDVTGKRFQRNHFGTPCPILCIPKEILRLIEQGEVQIESQSSKAPEETGLKLSF